jgi:hypothetical protein
MKQLKKDPVNNAHKTDALMENDDFDSEALEKF